MKVKKLFQGGESDLAKFLRIEVLSNKRTLRIEK